MPEPVQEQGFRFDAFVSYARADIAFARALQHNLETRFKSLTKRVCGSKKRLVLFRDETDLTSAGYLLKALLERIGESRNLLVICSPASRSAAWVNREIEGYRTAHGTTGNEGIVAILLAGEDPVKDTAIPAALTENGQEPLAVEFRKERIEPAQDFKKYMKGDGLLRVLAPLLNVEYPELTNRHREYERRRLRRNAIISGMLAVIFAALSLVTFMSYKEADSQRRIALNNLNDALLGYAVAARLAIENGDLDRAAEDLAYMLRLSDSLPAEKPSFAPLLATFADDFLKLGKAFEAAGRFDGAEASYEVSINILDELIQTAQRKSSNKEWKRLAESRIQEFGRPGEVYMLTESGDAPKVIDRWRQQLKEVTRRFEALP